MRCSRGMSWRRGRSAGCSGRRGGARPTARSLARAEEQLGSDHDSGPVLFRRARKCSKSCSDPNGGADAAGPAIGVRAEWHLPWPRHPAARTRNLLRHPREGGDPGLPDSVIPAEAGIQSFRLLSRSHASVVGRATPHAGGLRRDGYGAPRSLRSLRGVPAPAALPAPRDKLAPLWPRAARAALRHIAQSEHEAWLDTLPSVALVATRGRQDVHRRRLCFTRAAARPHAALRRGVGGRPVACCCFCCRP
jgi:hypothetical protein